MTWFAVETTYTKDRDLLLATRPRHREYLRGLVDQGKVIAGGPWADDSGGFAIYHVAGAAELDHLLAMDPYTTEDCAAGRIVHEWKITLGPWAADGQ